MERGLRLKRMKKAKRGMERKKRTRDVGSTVNDGREREIDRSCQPAMPWS